MKRHERIEALRLRRAGASYQAILSELGVARSTLWRWLKAEGLVETQPQRLTEARRQAQRKAATVNHERRLQRTQAIVEQAKRDIPSLSGRELFLIGVALYWAEGTKQKPHNISHVSCLPTETLRCCASF
jgi:hypothetical protein